MSNVHGRFAVPASIPLRLAIALGLAVAALAARASDLPPYAGSYDEVSYGDIPHASSTSEAIAADRDFVANATATHDDASPGLVSAPAKSDEVQEGAEVRAAYDQPKAEANKGAAKSTTVAQPIPAKDSGD